MDLFAVSGGDVMELGDLAGDGEILSWVNVGVVSSGGVVFVAKWVVVDEIVYGVDVEFV